MVIAGRTRSSLEETASAVPSTTATSIHVADITRESDMKETAQSVGTWDVLVISAGDVTPPVQITDASMDEWWRVFEVCTVYLRSKKNSLIFSPGQCQRHGISSPSIRAHCKPNACSNHWCHDRSNGVAYRHAAWNLFIHGIEACTSQGDGIYSCRAPSHLRVCYSPWHD